MQGPRRQLLPRDDKDSYDAMIIRRDPHERVGYSSSRQRILLGKNLLRIHTRTLRANRHRYDIYDSRAVLLNIDSYWLCADISITIPLHWSCSELYQPIDDKNQVIKSVSCDINHYITKWCFICLSAYRYFHVVAKSTCYCFLPKPRYHTR